MQLSCGTWKSSISGNLNYGKDLPECQATYDISKTGVIFCVYNAVPDREERWKPNPAHVPSVFSWDITWIRNFASIYLLESPKKCKSTSNPLVIPTTFWHFSVRVIWWNRERRQPWRVFSSMTKIIKAIAITTPGKIIQIKLFYFLDQIIQHQRCQNWDDLHSFQAGLLRTIFMRLSNII